MIELAFIGSLNVAVGAVPALIPLEPAAGVFAGHGRRHRLGLDRGRHVRLDLGGAERAVVDADVVDQAVEEAGRVPLVGADPPVCWSCRRRPVNAVLATSTPPT